MELPERECTGRQTPCHQDEYGEGNALPSNEVGRGSGFVLMVIGIFISLAPWFLAGYLEMVGAKSCALGFIGGNVMAFYGFGCFITPIKTTDNKKERNGPVVLIGILTAVIETFFFGKYLDLW